ncbi:hypothetical protein ARC02_16360 [Stenotrophomonas africana]|nr:hypothetical protein ARC02_16360 [Stenotrophomonas maltophilia]
MLGGDCQIEIQLLRASDLPIKEGEMNFIQGQIVKTVLGAGTTLYIFNANVIKYDLPIPRAHTVRSDG